MCLSLFFKGHMYSPQHTHTHIYTYTHTLILLEFFFRPQTVGLALKKACILLAN
ncbi:hypothetical protein Hanom_Chr04g00318401 [Helianthus anomalus]